MSAKKKKGERDSNCRNKSSESGPYQLTHSTHKPAKISIYPTATMSLARAASSKASLVAAQMSAKRSVPTNLSSAAPLSTSANMALDNLKGVLEEYRQVQ